jgi:hypothetical protein
MSEAKPRVKNWGLTAGMGAAIVVWQVYDIASTTEAQPTALLALQYFLIACGLVGAAGGLIMWMKQGAADQ